MSATKQHRQPETIEHYDSSNWLDKALEKAAFQLTEIKEQCGKALSETTDGTRRALLKSAARKRILAVLTDEVMADFMELQGKDYGFKTDLDWKDRPGYPVNVVREVLVNCFINGLSPHNQEINIIKGRCMVVLNGWRRMLHQVEGLEYPKLMPGVPIEAGPKTYRVPFKATWVYHGKPDSIERDFFVKRDYDGSGQKETSTVDNVLGRAERKCLKEIYIRVTGGDAVEFADDDSASELATTLHESKPVKSSEQPANPARIAALDRARVAYRKLTDAKIYGPEDMARDLNSGFSVESVAQLDDSDCERWATLLESRVQKLGGSAAPEDRGDAWEPNAA